jgi:hypothetical protein
MYEDFSGFLPSEMRISAAETTEAHSTFHQTAKQPDFSRTMPQPSLISLLVVLSFQATICSPFQLYILRMGLLRHHLLAACAQMPVLEELHIICISGFEIPQDPFSVLPWI